MSISRLLTIDSDYIGPGFAACYLRVQGEEAAFIETNTAHAVPRLLAALRDEGLDPKQVRWVIVTHAHLDHAGGASALLQACPEATLVAHRRAARHLIDPSRLVASAQSVYGEEAFAKMYGSLEPIPAERVRAVEDGDTIELGSATFCFLHTRGHANHHVAVHDPERRTVFTGDTFGLAYPHLQRAGRFAFASTSPTDFNAAEARKSVDRILSLGTPTACLTHFGEVDQLETMAAQLRRWIDRSEVLEELVPTLDPEEAEEVVADALIEAMDEEASAVGLELDPDDWKLLDMDIRLNAQGLIFAANRPPR